MAREVAGSVNGDATGDEKRAVDGADNFESGDFVGRSGEGVTAVGAGVGDKQTGFGEGLKDLGQKLRRDVVCLGDVLGRLGGICAIADGGSEGLLLGEILQGLRRAEDNSSYGKRGAERGSCAGSTDGTGRCKSGY